MFEKIERLAEEYYATTNKQPNVVILSRPYASALVRQMKSRLTFGNTKGEAIGYIPSAYRVATNVGVLQVIVTDMMDETIRVERHIPMDEIVELQRRLQEAQRMPCKTGSSPFQDSRCLSKMKRHGRGLQSKTSTTAC